ncbi:MAG: histone deacetylase [Watsoniomyces obsoletus]|nr:MAG: histone deacetylase [Watsoniomyces obsoletus]
MFARAAVSRWTALRSSQRLIAVSPPPTPLRRFADKKKPASFRSGSVPHNKPVDGPHQTHLKSGVSAAGGPYARSTPTDPPTYSPEQEEFKTGGHSDANTTPNAPLNGPGVTEVNRTRIPPQSPNTHKQPPVVPEQEELSTSQGSDRNSAPKTPGGAQSASTSDALPSEPSAASNAPLPTFRVGQLPDLRQGIPSNFNNTSGELDLGRADAEGRESAGLPAAPGGRGGGDLPKIEYITSIERRKRRVARLVFSAVLLLAAGGTIYAGRNWESEEEERKHRDAPSGWGFKLFYNRLRARIWDTREYYTEPAFEKLLPDPDPALARPFTLVIGLEDVLVHSEWTREHGWRVAKRPGVDYFLRYLQQYYELVIFTTSPMAMAEAVIRKLDPYHIVLWPLFREATKYVDGHQVKDLSYLNRDLSKVIMIETDPNSAKLQPGNTIMLPKWNGDPKDRQLVALVPFLEYVATMGLTDARDVLKSFEGKHIPTEFAAREAIARKKFEEQMSRERSKRPQSRLGRGLLDAVMGGRSSAGLDPMDMSAAEAFEQGKMLQDYIRERGQKQYEMLEQEIRENGEKWLKEMAAEEERMQAEQMDGVKSSVMDFVKGFVGGRSPPPPSPSPEKEKEKEKDK